MPPERQFALSLLISGKQIYQVEENLAFQLTITNLGRKTVLLPTAACSKASAIANRPGVMEACINLEFAKPGGGDDWFTGPCLCGHPKDAVSSLKELRSGDSMVLRSSARVLLADPGLFSEVGEGSGPSLILIPDLNLYRESFPKPERSKAIDGCVEHLPVQVEKGAGVPVQIVAAPRNQKRERIESPGDPK